MTHSKTRFLCISALVIYVLRLLTLNSSIPPGWTPDATVRFTARILEVPEHTDTHTILRSGRWTIKMKGYAAITPGSIYTFIGRIEPRLLMGMPTKIVMVDPTFVPHLPQEVPQLALVESVLLEIGKWRAHIVSRFQKSLPEPHASLAAGILLGVKGTIPQEFYDSLVSTGSLHIVAASGYNISIVSKAIIVPFSLVFGRLVAIISGLIGIFLYVLIAGGSASIVRAGIMGTLTLSVYIWGRIPLAKRLLWITAWVMILFDPLIVGDIGFQLSVAATAGLLYGEPPLSSFCSKIVRNVSRTYCKGRVLDYLFKMELANIIYSSLAATLFTLPIVLWHFGRISWISPIVNVLVLPVIPLIMFLSSLFAVLGIIPFLGDMISGILYVPLFYLVEVIRLFG